MKDKSVKDLINKYSSQLKDEQNQKLSKRINEEKILHLKSKIEELKSKLKWI